jgi:hypothetical protein
MRITSVSIEKTINMPVLYASTLLLLLVAGMNIRPVVLELGAPLGDSTTKWGASGFFCGKEAFFV